MSSWYGKTTSKELDNLIDRKAKLNELLLYPDFITELKSYNTKLLDYITNNPSLIGEMVDFLTIPPRENDTEERKYKLPLMAIEMIQTETTCVHNALFKQSPTGQTYYEYLFKLLDCQQILPILAGYLFRANICLLNNRQKQTIDKIYSMPQIFNKLIDHSYHMSIANIIQLFINLDINKHQNNAESEARVKVKIQILQQMINKIQAESGLRNEKSTMIIENLCGILCETIEKYYLIINGKQMMQVITAQKTISLFMSMIRSPYSSDNAFPAFNFFISLINYYSFSSFNVDDLGNEEGKKNLQRLENQPMIVELTNYFSNALQRIMRSSVMTLYLYRLLEVLCHCISISSIKVFECTRKTQFFNNLVKLMFTHEKNNILHVLVEKSFLHIFISDRKIYQQYKKHLFCEIDIIDSTAGFFIRQFPIDKLFEQGKKKSYFGHFMRILKIYSGIQTQDQAIVQAIRAKSELWGKISKYLIIPYENVYEKKLGTYESVPEPVYQQFKVDKNPKIKSNPLKNSTIQQINKQQNVPMAAVMPKKQIQLDPYTKMQELQQKKAQQLFYRAPITGFLASNEINTTTPTNANSNNSSTISTNGSAATLSSILKQQQQPQLAHPSTHMSQSNVVQYESGSDKELKKSESFKEFMNKKKVQAEQEIKIKRSLSHQKRLSGNKTKLASPSPSKKNSWKDQSTEEVTKPNIVSQSQANVPKIPLNRRPLVQTSVTERVQQINPTMSPHNTTAPQINPNISSIQNTSIISNANNTSTFLNNTNNTSILKDQTLDEINKLNNSIAQKFDIKKIKIYQIEKPAQKKYRKIEDKDRELLQFLGINVM